MRPTYQAAVWCAFCFVPIATPASAQEDSEPQVTLQGLLREMVNRDALARWPDPAYLCKQASSYDRDADDPQNLDTWFANSDRSQFIRTEERDGRTERVMMDADGAGAIVRIWGTWHGSQGQPFSNGTLRIYLDGADEPTIEGPITEIISGGALVGAPLSDYQSKNCPEGNRAHNLFLPIPYANGCKVTYETKAPMDRGATEGGEALYYQINYRTYAEGTTVESFTPEVLVAANEEVARTQQLLSSSGRWQEETTATNSDLVGTIVPGRSRRIEIEGPGAVRRMVFRITAEDLAQALRSTIVDISFDGEACVWAPLGDLMGIGYDMNVYKTWQTAAGGDDALTAYWTMPFEKIAVIRVRNVGEQPVEVEVADVSTGPWDWDDRSMHFHATWRNYGKVDTRDEGRYFDVNFVTVEGQGVYVGDSLAVFNAARAWWGEGDEKIFVDGESFPSHFGTGTEDYYGYAWCRPEWFSAPLHAQPTGAGNMEPGYSSNVRHRALDGIPFNKSLRFDMELWHWHDTRVNYAPTTYWYARPGATDNVNHSLLDAAASVAHRRSDLVEVPHVDGAIEGEELQVIGSTGGSIEWQQLPDTGWSNDEQIWWRDAKDGDSLELEFKVQEAGMYRVQANLTKANDYGIVELAIDDYPPVGPLDRYDDSVQHSLVDLGEQQLEAGAHRLKVRITGANDKAVPRRMFGLDYLLLQPLDE